MTQEPAGSAADALRDVLAAYEREWLDVTPPAGHPLIHGIFQRLPDRLATLAAEEPAEGLGKYAAAIADVLERADNRAMAADGPVGGTAENIDPEDYRKLYAAARQIAAYVARPTPAREGLDVDRLARFAEDVVRQWGYVGGGAISSGGLSTLEDAFEILGWDDPHPLPEGDPARCDEPGCGAASSSGWPSPSGYRHTCHEHSDFHLNRRCNHPPDSSHWAALARAEERT